MNLLDIDFSSCFFEYGLITLGGVFFLKKHMNDVLFLDLQLRKSFLNIFMGCFIEIILILKESLYLFFNLINDSLGYSDVLYDLTDLINIDVFVPVALRTFNSFAFLSLYAPEISDLIARGGRMFLECHMTTTFATKTNIFSE